MPPANVTKNHTPKGKPGAVSLRIISGPHEGEQHSFDAHNTLVVGRADDAQWRMSKDASFSRYHFRIEANPPACWLVDLGSANGVRVNGSRVQNFHLKDGDRIECGKTVFAVTVVAAEQDESQTPTLEVPPELRVIPEAIQPAPAPAMPSRLPDFDVTRELGHGGMGVVYHAIQKSTGREAAIKLIRPAELAAPAATQLFLREAIILSRLQHPRIVEYLSLGLHEGQMFLAMEYLPTLDFPKLLATQSRPKQIRLACGVICRVLEALQFAHEQDVVHRDVKPNNLLIYKQGGRVQVKLADFGLAKNYQDAGMSAISCENEVRGTLRYMAPEQIINCRYAKPPCDIFSTGACLYRYLSGKHHVEMDDSLSPFAQILNSPPVPLGKRIDDIPPDLGKIVDRALAHDPADRFSSAQHMRQALQKFTEK